MNEILLGGGAIAGLLAFMGAWVLASRPGHALNRALSAYLILTAGVMVFLGVSRVTPESPLVYARIILWFDIPQLVLIPFVLDEMLLAKPRTRARRAALLGLALTVAALLLALVIAGDLYFPFAPPGTPLRLGVLYAFGNDLVHALPVLLAAFVATRPDRTQLQRRQAALVGAAFACLALHSAASLAGNLPFLYLGVHLNVAAPLDEGGLAALLGLLALPAIPGILAPFAGSTRRRMVAALGAATLLGATQGAMEWLGGQPSFGSFEILARVGRMIVWAEVAVFLAIAVFRFGVAGVTVDARPRLATATGIVFAGALAAGFFLAALAWLGATPVGIGIGLAGAASSLALPRAPLRDLSMLVTDRLLLAPDDPGVTRERARIYAAALRAAVAERGAVPPADDPALRELRRRLGLGLRDHDLLASTLDTRAETLTPGSLFLGRYRIARELGRGGFGEAFLARDERLGRDVVLKRLRGDRSRDAEALRRFQREARLAATVEHPNIVAVHGTEAGPDGAYLVMEYLAGGSLADRLRTSGLLSEAQATTIARDALAGLAALHARGIVHRDVKPGNILLTAENRAKLGDFTIAREVISGETEGGAGRTPAGTLAYIAPEQARGKPATLQSDLYSLGASIYEALAGRPVVDLGGLTDYEASLRVASPAPKLPLEGVSDRMNAWLAAALAKDPRRRPADARALAAALPGPAKAVSPAGTPAGSAPRRPRRPA
jgi:tRNA A-37 threonylcarbamoyl transferase component Bud32